MDIVVIIIGLLGTAILLGAALFWGLNRKRTTTPSPIAETTPPKLPSLLSQRLEKTRGSILGRLSQFLNREGADGLSLEDWNQIEEVLLEADVGYGTTQLLLNTAKDQLKTHKELGLKEVLRQVSENLFTFEKDGFLGEGVDKKPWVISVVGINGAGKTTTIGKLAQQFKASGKTVLLGAVDTFRAGAISQLKVWADRTGAQFITGREGADPGAVAFDSVTAARARGVDVVLLDTAGRLHTKSNLMEELKKIHRVVKKVIPEAPHETWLVIDGTLGQNSVVQAKEFQKALDLTGIIVTKLDGTAKGGAILAIASELKLPIRYIGVGESVEDLTPFESKSFIDAILG